MPSPLIDCLRHLCESVLKVSEAAMAVAECPNCKHDIQTPEFRFFSNKQWKDFHCPYCRAELKKHTDKWPQHLLTAASGLAVLGISHQYLKYAQLVVPFVGLIWVLMHLSRPRLEVVAAPHDPASELKLRHAENQPEIPSQQELETAWTRRRNRAEDLISLRLR